MSRKGSEPLKWPLLRADELHDPVVCTRSTRLAGIGFWAGPARALGNSAGTPGVVGHAKAGANAGASTSSLLNLHHGVPGADLADIGSLLNILG